jgi:hypothetical protein
VLPVAAAAEVPQRQIVVFDFAAVAEDGVVDYSQIDLASAEVLHPAEDQLQAEDQHRSLVFRDLASAAVQMMEGDTD